MFQYNNNILLKSYYHSVYTIVSIFDSLRCYLGREQLTHWHCEKVIKEFNSRCGDSAQMRTKYKL